MKIIAPDYYNLFSCIGSRCEHNCCIGWEIDIDDFTLSCYKSMTGSLGKKLNDSICIDDEGAHFILDKDDRCPFLESDGLCRIIKEKGEKALCDICSDHPRFRNYFSDHIEIGIGLSCEEAARIILTNEKSVSFITLEDDNANEKLDFTESQFISERENLFSIISKKDISFFDKFSEMCCQYALPKFDNISKWAAILNDFEHLTPEWPALLDSLAASDITIKEIFFKTSFDKPFANMLHYFLMRHFIPSDSSGEKRAMVAASLLSACIIGAMFVMRGDMRLEALIDTARLYSSEIEYSDVNFEQLMLYLKDDNNV